MQRAFSSAAENTDNDKRLHRLLDLQDFLERALLSSISLPINRGNASQMPVPLTHTRTH